MAELTKPTEAPVVQEHKLDEVEHGMLRELRIIQIEHSNKIRALMGAFLSSLAATKWGYTGDQVLTFDLDMDDPKADVVKVTVAQPAAPQVAPQPATELPAEHEVPNTDAAPAAAPAPAPQPEAAPVEEPKAELPPQEEVSSAPQTQTEPAPAPVEPTTVPAPEAPQA